MRLPELVDTMPEGRRGLVTTRRDRVIGRHTLELGVDFDAGASFLKVLEASCGSGSTKTPTLALPAIRSGSQ